MYGGVFLYPANASSPGGKLRLLYEANPASFIAEQAGGRGSDGGGDILDVQPQTIHDRTQVREKYFFYVECTVSLLLLSLQLLTHGQGGGERDGPPAEGQKHVPSPAPNKWVPITKNQ